MTKKNCPSNSQIFRHAANAINLTAWYIPGQVGLLVLYLEANYWTIELTVSSTRAYYPLNV